MTRDEFVKLASTFGEGWRTAKLIDAFDAQAAELERLTKDDGGVCKVCGCEGRGLHVKINDALAEVEALRADRDVARAAAREHSDDWEREVDQRTSAEQEVAALKAKVEEKTAEAARIFDVLTVKESLLAEAVGAMRQHTEDWRKAAKTRERTANETPDDRTWASQRGYARGLIAAADALDAVLAKVRP